MSKKAPPKQLPARRQASPAAGSDAARGPEGQPKSGRAAGGKVGAAGSKPGHTEGKTLAATEPARDKTTSRAKAVAPGSVKAVPPVRASQSKPQSKAAAARAPSRNAAADVGERPAPEPAPPAAVLRRRKAKSSRTSMRQAKFAVGQVVKHRFYPFRGVVFDIDPVFANTDEWWDAIPEDIRPRKDQPFYHLLAENAETEYIAYVSEQNLLPDDNREPLRHPKIGELFLQDENGQYRALFLQAH